MSENVPNATSSSSVSEHAWWVHLSPRRLLGRRTHRLAWLSYWHWFRPDKRNCRLLLTVAMLRGSMDGRISKGGLDQGLEKFCESKGRSGVKLECWKALQFASPRCQIHSYCSSLHRSIGLLPSCSWLGRNVNCENVTFTFGADRNRSQSAIALFWTFLSRRINKIRLGTSASVTKRTEK